MTMKKIFMMLVAVMALSAISCAADDRPVKFDQLPKAARNFITENFAGAQITYAVKDDDIISPDYEVVLSNGVKISFEHDGTMDKIESREPGVVDAFVPAKIKEYVKVHYPDAYFVEYELGRNLYEVQLSNRLELKFSKDFNLVAIDD